jgi:predicted dehydrogenase
VYCWTNRPIWPRGLSNHPEPAPVPDSLAWDLWLGPTPERAYSPDYCPFKWRGWWGFGTGPLGDMGCHIMDMPYWALDLKSPTRVEADAEGNTPLSGPKASTVTYHFPAGPYSGELAFVWYDGGRMPSEDILSGIDLPQDQVAKRFDLVLIGEKGKFFFQRGNTNWITSPRSLLKDIGDPPTSLPRVKNEDVEWLSACKGGPPALSNFENSGPFTEVVLLGNLAIRLGHPIEWDGPNMKATNAPEADALIRPEYRKGWELSL